MLEEKEGGKAFEIFECALSNLRKHMFVLIKGKLYNKSLKGSRGLAANREYLSQFKCFIGV